MNLMKLFNKNYLKQNLKKSRTGLGITILIVPLLTVLVMINNSSGFRSSVIISNIISMLGMFTIPIAISKMLFGYVFKRKSVDFIGSMPLSRKTIFVTNLIGGILVIVFIQLLTSISIGITSLFLDNIIINMKMLIDFFVLGVISYTFVYTATNIGMAISGNLLTQIAVTMLILFLIPFTIDAVNGFDFYNQVEFVKEDGQNIEIGLKDYQNYTMPYNFVRNFFINESLAYTTSSIVRMLILIAIYSVIGIILFQKRKMENTEEAFSNVYVHLLVKGLTLIPIVAIVTLTNMSVNGLSLVIAIMFIYYYIYDMITKRKVKLRIEIVAFILTTVVLFGTFNFTKSMNNKKIKIYTKEDIKSIGIIENSIYYSSYENNIKDLEEINYQFENQDIIDEFYKGMKNFSYISPVELYGKIKLKNGKEVFSKFPMNIENFEKIQKMIKEDKKYLEAKKRDLEIKNNNEYIMVLNNSKINGEDKEKLVKLINKVVSKQNSLIEHSMISGNSIDCYYYENHDLKKIKIPLSLDDELKSFAMNLTNKLTKEKLKNINLDEKGLYTSCTIKELETEPKDDYVRRRSKEMIEFVKNAGENVDITRPIYSISLYFSKVIDGTITFYTNDIKEVDRLIDSGKDIINIPDTYLKY